jgi:hypothetical protein
MEGSMATVAVVFGGMVGFLVAMIGLVAFGVTALHALALWSLSGMVVAGVLMVYSRGARPSTTRLEAAQI